MEAHVTALAELTEHEEQIAGTNAFWLAADPPPGKSPVIYVHGVPNNADIWKPFLERTGGAAIDLPGYGRSEKHQNFDYSIGGYNAFLQAFIGRMGWDRFSIAVHDWGGCALVTAQEMRDRVDRLLIVNAVPLLPGYRWHWIAQLWRRRPVGEILNATTTRSSLALLMRQARGDRGPMPPEFVDMIWGHWDKGTRDATLALYRHADPGRLAQAGQDLGRIACAGLVVWGDRDIYLPTRFAEAYAAALPGSRLQVEIGAGHWPWIERPGLVGEIVDFLA